MSWTTLVAILVLLPLAGAIGFAAQPPIRGVTDAVGLFRHRESLNPEAFTSLKW